MIVAVTLALMLPVGSGAPCVAWRDSAGRIVDARAVQERREAARRQMLNDFGSTSAPIQDLRAPLPCVRRAGEPVVTPSPAASGTAGG